MSREPALSIWIGRPQEEVGPWIDAARRAGWEARTLPLIETVPLPLSADDRQLLLDLEQFAWVFFCSTNAVRFTFDVRAGLPWPASVQVGAVGPRTLRALEAEKVAVAHIAPDGTSASLADSFLARGLEPAGTPVLLPVARKGRTELRETLIAAGHPVTVVPLYDTLPVNGPTPPDDEPILLFSPSAVSSYRSRVTDPSRHTVWAVGPTTAEAARREGFQVAAVLNEPSPEALRTLISQ